MCGICASSHDPDGRASAAMCALLRHRGPNDEGVHVDREAGVSIGARRLSIIDLETGHQPLSNEDGSVHAVFNGEIYNFAGLREQLQRRGHQLQTRSDTEVLVHLYEDYGDDLVHALDGMFTFILWDARRRRMLLARDRFGEKPLFYREHNGRFEAASELTALTDSSNGRPERVLDPSCVDAFFVFGYVPGAASIVEGARQLPPGHLLTWEPGEPLREPTQYWRPPRYDSTRRDSLGDLADEVSELLDLSVRRRLVSDVPLGVFLSGGVDSTLCAALAARHSSRPIKTFTVGYTVGDLNETPVAREVANALGAEHHELILTEHEVAEQVPTLLGGLDQPLADQALIALHAVAGFARDSVTVAVGGEGADELFAGYPRYRWLSMAAKLNLAVPPALGPLARRAAMPAGASSRVRRLTAAVAAESTFLRHVDWVTSGRRHLRPFLYGPALTRLRDVPPPEPDGFDIDGDTPLAGQLMRLDQQHWLPDDVLAKADRASMLASLELRTPYLSRELAEFAAAIPVDVHLQQGGKAVLRRALRNLEEGNDFKRVKTAFRVPVADWLRGPLQPLLRSQLRSSAIFSQGWFDRAAVSRLAERHLSREEDRSEALWPIVVLGCWLDGGAPQE
jgi:asparagine synthase (glutamine-hydrolysing)